MPRVSPTLEGFRATFRKPLLTLAEIAWRWTVGGLAWALLFFWCIEYLDTLPVSSGDATLLSTRQPFLVGRAIAHILHGSMGRAVPAALFALIALSLLWIIAASLGRAATVRALLEYFRKDVAWKVSADSVPTSGHDTTTGRPLRSLIALSFFRAALTLAALLAFVGAAVLVGFVSSDKNPRPGLVFILFLPLAAVICMVWSTLNWLLSLAGVFAVRDGEQALGAISAAVAFSRERSGPVFAVSTWTGLAHLTAFSIAGTAVSLPLALIQVAPPRLVIAGIVLVTLLYLAVAHWLYMVRLAGYVCIAEMPEALTSSAPLPTPPPQASIDRDELILSDLPNLAIET